MLTDYLFGSC